MRVNQIDLGAFQNNLIGLLVLCVCGGGFIYILSKIDKPSSVTGNHNAQNKKPKKIFLTNHRNKKRAI